MLRPAPRARRRVAGRIACSGSRSQNPRVPAARSRLQRLLARIEAPRAAIATDPWHLILLENVVYLADDDARGRAFATLRAHTDLDAKTIARCPDDVLLAACREGRMPEQQVRKLRECAALFDEAGDPRELVRLPPAQARKALRRFPGIGDPGADKLLLLAGAAPILAVDSNGLRVLLRLGYGQEAKSYAASYRAAQRAAMAELPAIARACIDAHRKLRRHGQLTCRRSAPHCTECVLRADCPSAGTAGG